MTNGRFPIRLLSLCAGAALLAGGAAIAQNPPVVPPPSPPPARSAPVITQTYVGEVVRTTDGRLTVTRENSAPISFRLDPNARILLNGQPARLIDLKAGDRVRVEPNDRDALFAVSVVAERLPAEGPAVVDPLLPARELHSGLGLTLAASPAGVMVLDVLAGGPADRVGLRPGDYILQVGSTDVNTPDGTLALVRELPPGSTIELKVWRDGQQSDMAVVLANAASAPDTVAGSGTPRVARRVAVAPDVGLRLIRTDAGAVQVADVVADSLAARAGLRPGDVIVSVAGTRVAVPATVTELLNAADAAAEVVVLREGVTRTLELALMPELVVRESPPIIVPADSPEYVRLLLQHQQTQEQMLDRLFREIQTLRAEVNELRSR